MSPIDYIYIALIVIIPAVIIGCTLLFTKEDYDDAGVHLGNDPVPLDLARIYRDPIGFEPAHVRDTFVPSHIDTMSTDEFLGHLLDLIEGDGVPTWEDIRDSLERSRQMLVGARDIMDDCLVEIDDDSESGINDRIGNWLVRGHQD